MFVLAAEPAGELHVVGAVFVPVKISILLRPSERGGLAAAAAVMVYPTNAFVTTVVSIAAILVDPEVSVPKGIVEAVVVTFVAAELIAPEVFTA